MPKKIYNPKRFKEVYNDPVHYPTMVHVALALGAAEKTVRDWVYKAKAEGIDLIDRNNVDPSYDSLKYGHKIAELNAKISSLQSQLKESYHETSSSQKILEMFYDSKDVKFDKKPDWLTYLKGKRSGLTGIPTLFLSDIHYDEVVNPAEVEYLNEYNHEIADLRIKHTFNTALDLLTQKMHSPKYEGSVVMLGGDVLSGTIHSELAETNDQHILKSIIDAAEVLAQGIGQFADQFGKVYVPCVVGNHGRMHHKPRAKGRVAENFEYLIYHLIAKHFKNDSRVTVEIPESADCQFNIYQRRILLTHGDQFKGGSGISGIFSPLMIGRARKLQRQSAVNKGFDLLAMGHWHQYLHTEHLLINSSVKGYDEYAYVSNFNFERPQQALFVVHPEHGVTFRMPVLCDSYEGPGGYKKLK
jgi:hypothetical protein